MYAYVNVCTYLYIRIDRVEGVGVGWPLRRSVQVARRGRAGAHTCWIYNIHTYTHIYVFIYICIYICIYIYIYIYIHVYTSLCMYLYTCMCIYKHTRVQGVGDGAPLRRSVQAARRGRAGACTCRLASPAPVWEVWICYCWQEIAFGFPIVDRKLLVSYRW